MQDRPKRILIVEDEAVISLEIEAALRQLGYAIAGKAANGDKALDLLASSQPDLVLLDIDIRGSRNGIDLARLIREKYDYPFVFLTAFSDPATLDSLRDTLPYGYIVKPFNDSDLYTTIELALDKFAAERQPVVPALEDLNERLSVSLSGREYDVLLLLETGKPYREIAEILFLSLNTVKYHQKSIFSKLNLSSRHQLSAYLRSLDRT